MRLRIVFMALLLMPFLQASADDSGSAQTSSQTLWSLASPVQPACNACTPLFPVPAFTPVPIVSSLVINPANANQNTALSSTLHPDASVPILATSSESTDTSSPLPAATATAVPQTVNAPVSKVPKNLWTRIRNGFALGNDQNDPRVASQLNWYSQRPEYVDRMVQRSKRYLYHILGEVEKRGMPSEIALLPMVESAYNPMAFSTSHASGIWQFLPSTGKNFGLHENSWYDGRRDIIAATNAALDYLTRLHRQFGSWDLALAAYNCGEGCVQRAIQRNQKRGLPTDYNSLDLPPQTREYVPKLMAVKELVNDPAATGIQLQDIPNQAYFTTITVDKPMDVSLAAHLAGIPVHDFLSLNPAYSRPVIRSDTPLELVLPVDHADTFTNNLSHYHAPLVSWQSCHAHAGEPLSIVARHCHVSVQTLKADNHFKLNRKGRFSKNETLMVPSGHHDLASQMADNNSADTGTQESAPSTARSDHPHDRHAVIRHGDRWNLIAKRYHVSETELRRLNAHVAMRAGNTIRLPDTGGHDSDPAHSAHKKTRRTPHHRVRHHHATG